MVLLFVMVCLMLYPNNVVFSQASVSVVVEPATISAHLGESFDVTVSVSNVQDLYGLEVILKWDASILRTKKVDVRLGVETFSDGVLHESSTSPPIFIAENNISQTGGEYRLVATSMAPAPAFSGSGNIVRITFEPIILGDSTLDLESQLFDYPPLDRDPRISFPIDHSTSDSVVTVKTSTPSSSPTPTPVQTPTLVPTPTASSSPTGAPTPTPTPKEGLLLSMDDLYVILVAVIIFVSLALIAYLKWRK